MLFGCKVTVSREGFVVHFLFCGCVLLSNDPRARSDNLGMRQVTCVMLSHDGRIIVSQTDLQDSGAQRGQVMQPLAIQMDSLHEANLSVLYES